MNIGYNPHLGYEDKVLRDYEKMVHSVANKFRRSTCAGVDYEDLVSVGTIGLIEAFRNYDPDRYQGKVTSFGTYAFPMIKWSIQRFLREKRYLVRVPRSIQDKLTVIRKQDWEQDSAEKIAEMGGWKVSEVREALRHLDGWSVASLDKAAAISNKGDEDISLLDMLPSMDDSTGINVQEFMSYLNPAEQEVLQLRLRDFSQKEIAKHIGKSQAHVSRTFLLIGEKYTQFQNGTLERSVFRMSKVRGNQAGFESIEWFIDERVSTNPTIGINGQGMHLNSRAVHTLGCKAGQCLRVGFDSEKNRLVIQVGDNGMKLRSTSGDKSGGLRLVNKRLANWLSQKKMVGSKRYSLYSEQSMGLHYIQLERHA